MKKKVGILTYHTGYNYGASLQAYALSTAIKRLVGDSQCEIINFETEAFVASREMFSRKPRRMKEIIKIITRMPYYRALKRRGELFDRFTRECLDASALYRTEREVIEHAQDYECIVCGSDQIWNLDRSSGPAANMIYYLNFPKKQRRVAYAASFGQWVEKAPNYDAKILPLLRTFDLLSAREYSGQQYLKSRGLACELMLDPTLLLDKEDYQEICAPRLIPERYVLVFSWACERAVLQAAKAVSKALGGLPVINIVAPPRALGWNIPRKLDVGPREFLSLIENAEFVVTGSFHGADFSTILEKPYVSVYGDKPDPRMETLLRKLGLSDHLTTGEDIDVARIMQTDYAAVRQEIAGLRAQAVDFLQRAVAL